MGLTDAKERIHTHTHTYRLILSLVPLFDKINSSIVKCVKNIIKISICLLPQIIVYKDRMLHGFEQTPK